MHEKVKCSTCNQEIERIEVFPRGQCIKCYAKDNTDEKGDFDTITKAFNQGAIVNR